MRLSVSSPSLTASSAASQPAPISSPLPSFAASCIFSSRSAFPLLLPRQNRSAAPRRLVGTAATAFTDEETVLQRRHVLLTAAAMGVASFTANPPPSLAAYGSPKEGDTAGSDDAAFITFYGAASPPATYGSLGGTVKDKAKYSFDVPSTWVEEATSKVEKGAGGQDSRWVAPGSRGRTKAVLLTLNRAGQDGAAYQLTGSALNAVAAADSGLQAVLQSGTISDPVTSVEDGQEYVTYDIESAQHYVIKAAIDNTGRLFAFIVTAPERNFQQDKKMFSKMVASFKTYRSASQFV